MAGLAKVNGLDLAHIALGEGALLASGDLSAAATWASGTFTAHDILIVRFQLTNTTNAAIAQLQINGDAGNNYAHVTRSQTTLTAATSQAHIDLYKTPTQAYPSSGVLVIAGKRIDANSTDAGVGAMIGGPEFSATGAKLESGEWTGLPSGGIVSLQLSVSAGNMNGTIRVYGHDFP